jgi:protein TonB
MFDNLLESRHKRQRSLGSTFFSVLFHAGLIGLAVVATSDVGKAALDDMREEKVEFVEVKKEEPPPPPDVPPPDVVHTPPPPKGFQILTAPVNIPDVLPEIDITKAVTNEADFTGKGAVGGTAKGVVGGVAPPIQSDQPYWDFQVEKPAQWLSGTGEPSYPEMLKSAGIEGSVLATFVIDTMGRAEMNTFKVLRSPQELFTRAVRTALPRMRFLPAEVGNRKVKQVVQQEFTFTITP